MEMNEIMYKEIKVENILTYRTSHVQVTQHVHNEPSMYRLYAASLLEHLDHVNHLDPATKQNTKPCTPTSVQYPQPVECRIMSSYN